LATFEIEAIGFGIGGPGAAQALLLSAGELNAKTVRNIARDVALKLGDIGEFAGVVRAPEFGAIGRIDQIGIDAEFVTVLGNATHNNCTNLERFANLAWVVFFTFETEDGAAGHHSEIGKLGESADETLGESVAEIFVVGVGGGVDEGENGDGSDLRGS